MMKEVIFTIFTTFCFMQNFMIISLQLHLYFLSLTGRPVCPRVMPTTCGFPNCKFRSRYKGTDDPRHFYRVPKRPAILRERWLEAIGRTEETIVGQVA